MIGGKYPVVHITPLGEETLNTRAIIEVQLTHAPSPAARAEAKQTKQPGGTYTRTLELLEQGKSPTEIAKARNLALTTIYGHLERLIAENKITAQQFVPTEIHSQICAAILDWDGKWLTDLKARLPMAITYEQIRLVLAEQKKLSANEIQKD